MPKESSRILVVNRLTNRTNTNLPYKKAVFFAIRELIVVSADNFIFL